MAMTPSLACAMLGTLETLVMWIASVIQIHVRMEEVAPEQLLVALLSPAHVQMDLKGTDVKVKINYRVLHLM